MIKVDTINEGILRAAIRFACANEGTAPDECYEVIGRKILSGELTAICSSWHNAFVSYYQGAAAFYGPTSGYQERDARIAVLESRPDAAEVLQRVRERIVLEDDPAGYFRGILDAVEASLTGPKKPTKPAVDHVHELGSCTVCDAKPQACADCGGTGLLLSGQQCSDCRGKGYL